MASITPNAIRPAGVLADRKSSTMAAVVKPVDTVDNFRVNFESRRSFIMFSTSLAGTAA